MRCHEAHSPAAMRLGKFLIADEWGITNDAIERRAFALLPPTKKISCGDDLCSMFA